MRTNKNNTGCRCFDPAWLDARLEALGRGRDKVIPLLQTIQKQYNYLPESALVYLYENSEMTPADVVGVSTFYSQFRHAPAGRHSINVCVGTACHVKGADLVYDGFHRYLGCAEGEDTDAQRLFTVNKVACLGCCSLAPAVQIDDIIYGHVTAASAGDILKDFLERQKLRGADKKTASGKEAAIDAGNKYYDQIVRQQVTQQLGKTIEYNKGFEPPANEPAKEQANRMSLAG